MYYSKYIKSISKQLGTTYLNSVIPAKQSKFRNEKKKFCYIQTLMNKFKQR